jgi:hypothetical protein
MRSCPLHGSYQSHRSLRHRRTEIIGRSCTRYTLDAFHFRHTCLATMPLKFKIGRFQHQVMEFDFPATRLEIIAQRLTQDGCRIGTLPKEAEKWQC